MRILKLCVALGMVLAITGVAQALPFNHSWTGPIFWHIEDYSQGQSYAFVTDKLDLDFQKPLLADGGVGAFGVSYTPDQLVKIPGNAINADEGGWSVFKVQAIYEGKVDALNTITINDSDDPVLFLDGDNDLELAGTLFNRNDINVTFTKNATPGQGPTQEFEFVGDLISMYLQADNTYDNAAAGSSGRIPLLGNTAAGPWDDKYDSIGWTWVDDGDGIVQAGEVVSVGTLILTMNSEVGYFGGDPAAEGRASFKANLLGGSGSGDNDAYYSIVEPEVSQDAINMNLDFFTPEKDGTQPDGSAWPKADFRVHVTNTAITPHGTFDWLVQSSDPVTSTIVPEPLTVLAVLTGIGGLGHYIRKRRVG